MGRPSANASIVTIGKPSGHTEGITRKAARAISSVTPKRYQLLSS